MVNRVSALDGHYSAGQFGNSDFAVGVHFEEIPNLLLYQIAAWPDTIDAVGKQAARAAGFRGQAPGPTKALVGKQAALLRIEPLKWWLVGAEAPSIDAQQGTTLDLSHARTRLRISGPEATALLNRHLPLDLRTQSFNPGSVASSAIHHVGLTLWHSEKGYEMFIPRSFAVSIWELLFASAKQFGVEVKSS